MIYILVIFTLMVLPLWIFIKNRRCKLVLSLLVVFFPLLVFFITGAKIYAISLFVPSYMFILLSNHKEITLKKWRKNLIVVTPIALLMLWLLIKESAGLTQLSSNNDLMICVTLTVVLVFVATSFSLIAMARTKGDITHD